MVTQVAISPYTLEQGNTAPPSWKKSRSVQHLEFRAEPPVRCLFGQERGFGSACISILAVGLGFVGPQRRLVDATVG